MAREILVPAPRVSITDTGPSRLSRILRPSSVQLPTSFSEWREIGGRNEGVISDFLYSVGDKVRGSIVTSSLFTDLERYFGDKKERLRDYFHEGLRAVAEDDKFVITSSSRISRGTSMNGTIAIGGKLDFEIWNGSWNTQRRSARGSIIGILCNGSDDLEALARRKGRYQSVLEAGRALIAGAKELIEARRTGAIDQVLTQEEFDRVNRWVLFDPEVAIAESGSY